MQTKPTDSGGQCLANEGVRDTTEHVYEAIFWNNDTLLFFFSLFLRFEGRLKKLRWWLEHMEKRMTTDFLEAKQRSPEKAVLDQVEEYQQEVLKER